MTHVSFEEYEAAKAEIIGGVHYKEKSTLEGNVIRKTYVTEENGTFYEVNDGGRIEFWSDKHPDSRIYDENERADLPEKVGAVPGSGDLLAEKIRETADFANLKPFEKFVLDNGYLYDSSDALKAGYWNKIDKKMTRRLIDSIVDSVNIWLNGLVNEEKLLGGRVEFLEEENSQTALMAGKAVFHIYLTPPSPMKECEFVLEYDAEYVSSALAA